MDSSTRREPFCASGTRVNRPTMWKGTGRVNHTPGDYHRNRMERLGGGSSLKRPEDHYEALIQYLQNEENYFKDMIFSTGVMSASVVFCMVQTIRNIDTRPPPLSDLYAMIRSQFSKGNMPPIAAPQSPVPPMSSNPPYQTNISPPPTFDTSSSRNIMYWATALVFSSSAVILAVLGKRMVRDRRDRLLLRGAPWIWNISDKLESDQEWVVSRAMYRLFMVAMVLLFFAITDVIMISVNLTVFALIVVCGLRYVFGAIGPARIL